MNRKTQFARIDKQRNKTIVIGNKPYSDCKVENPFMHGFNHKTGKPLCDCNPINKPIKRGKLVHVQIDLKSE